ncbi:MAG: signal peptidase I, partial [Pseudomonadota bacterium]
MSHVAFSANFYHRFKGQIFFILFWAALFIALKFFVLDLYRIPSSSMQPTLIEGDHVVGLKIFFKHRGNVVAIKRAEDKYIYIKRIAALPNDLINVKAGTVSINKQKLKTVFDNDTKRYRYIENSDVVYLESNGGRSYPVLYNNVKRPLDLEKEYKVSGQGVFLLGDNRVNSVDSRTWGEIKKSDVMSRIVLVWFSRDPETHAIRWD